MLRFITCGSVDDGKSTLVGRLLHDCGAIHQDHLSALERDSGQFGTQGGAIDFALLVDGLSAEREQGITIDVAHRYFATGKRKFIIADCPGHEQYTRNMVTGASTANLALILVDARKGIMAQTRRHSFVCHKLGIRNFVLAVTKMDLVGYDPGTYEAISSAYAAFAHSAGIEEFTAVPVSGLEGDNVVRKSSRMDWYAGPSLLDHLETVETNAEPHSAGPFRMPVQWVNRPNPNFRGFCGTIASGTVSPGDAVRVLPAGRNATVEAVMLGIETLDRAQAGQAITICLAEAVDCGRGSVIAAADRPPETSDQFEATIVWLDDDPMLPGRAYGLKLAGQTASATVAAPKYEIDVDTMVRLAVKTLGSNAIGVAEMTVDRPIVFEPYAKSRNLGGFILIDKVTNRTVAAGMLHFSLRRAQNIRWQPTDITRDHHAALKNQAPRVLWFTGLSGSGKSTIANEVEKRLALLNRHTFLLDGDNVRHRLNKDLGFTDADRIENIRRVGEVARLMTDAGLIVLTAFISPFRAERRMVREMFAADEFLEIFVDTPLEVAEQRDVKGLYAKARAGEIRNFTGIDSPYEPPETPDIVVDTVAMSAQDAADLIIARLGTLK